MQRSSSIFAERLFDTQLISVSSVPYTAAGLAILERFPMSLSCFSICSSVSPFPSSICFFCILQAFLWEKSGGSLCPAAGSVACSVLGAASPGAFPSPVSCLACFNAIFCLLSSHTDLSLPWQMQITLFYAKMLPAAPVFPLRYLAEGWQEQGGVRRGNGGRHWFAC